MNAGVRELGRGTQDDIAAATRWAIERGIADPKRIAVMGASFGGYSTLMQLIRQPELYACGISQVGVANWPRLLENAPPYWRDALPMWRRFLGDLRRPEERLRLLASSTGSGRRSW
jgi:dipeptidyl aminopeptidase/acylaminoacyl peptidase